MNVILLGPPGCGKGTQAFIIKDKLGLTHLSTGDLFRAAIANQTKIGLEAKAYMDEGKLVPDDVTTALVVEALLNLETGFMLDGFPRTIAQAESLTQFLEENKIKLDAVINFSVATELLIERLTGRRVCRKCGASYHVVNRLPKVENVCDICGGELYQRSDDNEESAYVRLDEYFNKTKPLIEYYDNKNLLFNVDAGNSVEDCSKQVFDALGVL